MALIKPCMFVHIVEKQDERLCLKTEIALSLFAIFQLQPEQMILM